MSRRARERQEASDAKHYPERWQGFELGHHALVSLRRWQDERDDGEEELPEREEPEPVHTFH